MDGSIPLHETPDTMEPKELRDMVKEGQVYRFLKANELATEISRKLMHHHVVSIELEAWNRTIDGKKAVWPVLIFLLDDIEKLFEASQAAKVVYDNRLANKTNGTTPDYKSASSSNSPAARSNVSRPENSLSTTSPVGTLPDTPITEAAEPNSQPVEGLSKSSDTHLHPEKSTSKPPHTASETKQTSSCTRDIYGEFEHWKKVRQQQLEAYKEKEAEERRLYAEQNPEPAPSTSSPDILLLQQAESERLGTTQPQAQTTISSTVTPDLANSEETDLAVPTTMDNDPHIKQYNAQLRAAAIRSIDQHKRALEQKVEAFIKEEGKRFDRLFDDNFKTIVLHLNGGSGLEILSNGAALKLMGDDKDIARKYRELVQERLTEYYDVAKKDYDAKLLEIESEYRAVLRNNWPDGRDRVLDEATLDAIVEKGKTYEVEKHIFTNETGLEHMDLDYFEKEKQNDLKSFRGHAHGQLNSIRDDLRQPTVIEDRPCSVGGSVMDSLPTRPLRGGEGSYVETLPTTQPCCGGEAPYMQSHQATYQPARGREGPYLHSLPATHQSMRGEGSHMQSSSLADYQTSRAEEGSYMRSSPPPNSQPSRGGEASQMHPFHTQQSMRGEVMHSSPATQQPARNREPSNAQPNPPTHQPVRLGLQAPAQSTRTSDQQRFDRPPSRDGYPDLFADSLAAHLIPKTTENTTKIIRGPTRHFAAVAPPTLAPAKVWYADSRIAAMAAEGAFPNPQNPIRRVSKKKERENVAVDSSPYSPPPAISPSPGPGPLVPARKNFLDVVTEQDRMLMESGQRVMANESKELEVEEMMRGKSITDLLAAAKRK